MNANKKKEEEMKKIASQLQEDIQKLYAKTAPQVLSLYEGENEVTAILTVGGILNAMLSKLGRQSLADMVSDKVKVLQKIDDENE